MPYRAVIFDLFGTLVCSFTRQELTGAAEAGMRPVLKRIDLSDVYDRHRPDVENWRGLAVNEIKEICEISF